MSGFDAGWLALREPYDHAARASRPARLVLDWAAGREGLRIADLGSGTGSTLRALAPSLPAGQSWTLVEYDPALIDAGAAALASVDVAWRYERRDLAVELEEAVPAGTDLVTGSALVDLVGADWLARLVACVAERGCAMLMALSYDGRLAWSPTEPGDALAKTLFDRHQRGDKGLGPALGPDAAGTLERALSALPGTTCSASSDWLFGRGDVTIQAALVDGMATAASEADPASAERIAAWRRRRMALVDAGRSRLRLGHRDVGYVPAAPSSLA